MLRTPLKINSFWILAQKCCKIKVKIKLPSISLFHMRTRVSLKYFANDCSPAKPRNF